MDNQLSSDDEILNLNSGFNFSADNGTFLSKQKRARFAKINKAFKTKIPSKTTTKGYFSTTVFYIQHNAPVFFQLKSERRENHFKTKPAGCFTTILSENFDTFIKNLLTKNLSSKQLMKYCRYECN